MYRHEYKRVLANTLVVGSAIYSDGHPAYIVRLAQWEGLDSLLLWLSDARGIHWVECINPDSIVSRLL